MTRSTVCAFISAKGGSGKTVLSTSLAILLAAIGKRVLLVDCDAATNGLSLLYLQRLVAFRDNDREAQGLFEVVEGRTPQFLPIRENVDLIPATYRMRQTEATALKAVDYALKKILLDASDGYDGYDFIFLDAQAGADVHAEIAVRHASKAVIVTEYDPISAEGVERLKRLFSHSLENVEVWTLFNKVLPEFTSIRPDFLEVVRLLPPVPWDADVIRSFIRRELAVDTESGNPYTFVLVSVLKSLFYREIGNDLESWRTRTESFLRKPIEARLESLTEEISRVEAALVETNYQSKSLASRPLLIGLSLMTLSFVTLAVFVVGVFILPPGNYYTLIFTLIPALFALALSTFREPLLTIRLFKNRARREAELLAREREAYALQRRRSQLEEDILRYRKLLDADISVLSKEGRHIRPDAEPLG
jgi:cellulose biosynthesis protein BcsQ